MKLSLFITAIFILLSASFAFSADVKIAWDPNNEPDLKGYKVYYKKNNFCPPYNLAGKITFEEMEDPTRPKFTITGLKRNQKYYLAVTAYNSKGFESYYSNLPCVKIGRILKPCDSQVYNEINFDGEWITIVKDKFTINNLGSESIKSTGTFNFTFKDSNNGTIELILDDSAFSQASFSGIFYMANKGKRIKWCFDTYGTGNLEIYLKNWFLEMAQRKGLIFDPDAIEFRLLRVVNKKMRISKNTGVPIKGIIKARGQARGIFNGKFAKKYFKYKCKVFFID